jgi:glutamyl/glutaminyl-tRNA synthetase
MNEGRTADGSGPWGKTIHHSQQIEFSKLRPTYTVLSKRNLLKMVTDGVVKGWDDPRMPTLSGMRRRGYTPESIRSFVEDVGVTKVESFIDVIRLENAVRDDLNKKAPRRMAVLRPLKVIIENYAGGGRPRNSMPSTTPKTPPRDPAKSPSAASSTSSVKTSWKSPPRSSSASRPVSKSDSATPTSSSAPAS